MGEFFGISTSEQGKTIVISEDSGTPSLGNINQFLDKLDNVRKLGILSALIKISEDTGNYVQMSQELKFLPVLIDQNNQPIPLYHFVEVLDEIVDYDKIHQVFPTISFAQINGAVSFLRKLSLFNTAEIDIDQLEDEDTAQDQTFLNELRRALADQEITRVLYHD